MNKTVTHPFLKWIWVFAALIVLIVVGSTWRYYYIRGLTEISGYRVSRIVAGATKAYAAGQLAEAKSIYQTWLERHDSDAFAWNGLANVYRDERNYPAAEAAYLKAIAADRRFEQGYRNIYMLYALWSGQDATKLAKAEAILLEGLKYNSRSRTVLEDLVSYYSKVGNLIVARQYAVQLSQLQ